MAPTIPESSSPFSTDSYDTALCIIPPKDLCQNIDSLRELYDQAYGKWPPHINLVYPFVAFERLPELQELLQAKLANIDHDLNVTLDDCGCFSSRQSHSIHLRETPSTRESSLNHIRDAALEALSLPQRPYNFHLTVGQSEDKTYSSRDFLLSKVELLPSISFRIQSVALLAREQIPGQNKSDSRMRLWGTIDIGGHSLPVGPGSPGTWLQVQPPSRLEEDEPSPSDEEVSPDTITPSATRPATTYRIDFESGQWQPYRSNPAPTGQSLPSDLTVSSYNVLVDSVYPPARDRDPLVAQTVLTAHASADILVLQEISDDFLIYLLGNKEIRQRYPYTSHAPPSQPEVPPLPSLRNIIVLSRFHFDWSWLPFHRRHKGVVVASFNFLDKEGKIRSLVVAGVHLTCGLTDGSVAAKKVQLQNLLNHLRRAHATSTWVIAGDFNIPTSSHTIEMAIRNQSISQHSVKTLASLESMLSDTGLLDAWCLARVEANDESKFISQLSGEDILEGEDGATFNPRTNILAATTSGTSNNRPQRYDRILVRDNGFLRPTRFNMFGLPGECSAVDPSALDETVVPSDHFGIRAMMTVISGNTIKSAVSDSLALLPLELKRANIDLSYGSTLHEALAKYHMVPSEEEAKRRKETFDLISQVITGNIDAEDTSRGTVSLVTVPVGSYALGVWDASSDTDCLCIGSISSKTFFQLARQRILKASNAGIRILRKVEALSGTMLELSVNDISMDLQYCPAAIIAERWSDVSRLPPSDPAFNLSMLSLRKLKPFRDLDYVQKCLPDIATFRIAYRAIKLWAVQRGLYSAKFGYLSGVQITLMLAIVYKRLGHQFGSITAEVLVTTFFHHYANFDWANDIVYDPFFHKKRPRYQRTLREPMVILGFYAPNANVAHTSTLPGLRTLVKEFAQAEKTLNEDSMTWNRLFDASATQEVPGSPLPGGASNFLVSYDSYAKIDVQYWGRTQAKGKSLVGWLESKCLALVVDIHKTLPYLDVRSWPTRFTPDEKLGKDEKEYHGCYLIGLSQIESPASPLDKTDRQMAKDALLKALQRFEDLLHGDEKYYDQTTSWVGVHLVRKSEIRDLKLDNRQWGDRTVEDEALNSDDDDDDALENEGEGTTQQLPIREPTAIIPTEGRKLRPASDILNRLRWDPHLDPSDFIVGYEDRFVGVKETSLGRWKTEQTDEEFIPQHRIVYFRRRGDGVVVWDRRSRVDGIFGSGVGGG